MQRENDLTGKIIGDCRIRVELNSSSSYRTFLGESLSSTEFLPLVVIKLLMAGSHSSQEQQSILQEIATLQQLSHPHILPILSAGMYQDSLYWIRPYVIAGSLHQRLKSQPAEQLLPQEEALAILEQIGQALYYAHQHCIVHGNIKPENILFDSEDQVFVTDFHLSSLLPPDQEKKMNASEIAIRGGTEPISVQTSQMDDQYALGCLAYELFTGQKAFLVPSVSRSDTYYKTRSLISPKLLNPYLPLDIEEAILTALSREPAHRYSDISAFLTALGLSATSEDAEEKQEETVLVQAERTDPGFVSNLTDPGFANSLTDPGFVSNLTDPGFANSLTDPGFASNLTDPGLVNSLTDPDQVSVSKPAIGSVETTSRGYSLWNSVAPLKWEPEPSRKKMSVQKFWKRLPGERQRTLIPILCLVALAIVVATTLFTTLHFLTISNNMNTQPYPFYGTSIARIPTPTNVLSFVPAQPTSLSATPTSAIPTSVQSDPTPVSSQVGPTPAVVPGLVGYWKFDVGSGFTAHDSSGNGYTATLQPGVSWEPRKVGYFALSLTGASNSYVDIPEPVVNTAHSFSVAAWVKLNAFSDFETFVSLDGNNVSAFYLQWNHIAGTFIFNRFTSDLQSAPPVWAIASVKPALGVWYHLVGVYDASAYTISLYVNGTLQQTSSYTSGWQGTGHTIIGAAKYDGRTDYVNGEIDDVQIYDTALSAQTVASLAAAG